MRELRAAMKTGYELRDVRRVFAKHGITRQSIIARVLALMPKTLRKRFYFREMGLPIPKNLMK